MPFDGGGCWKMKLISLASRPIGQLAMGGIGVELWALVWA